MKPPKPTLKQILENWKVDVSDASLVEREVWRRIGRADARRSHVLVFALWAAACAIGALAIGEWKIAHVRRQLSSQFARQYLQLIDPLLETRADSLDAELSWIRSDLNLTPAQFSRIRELHKEAMRGLLVLNQEVSEARQEVAHLEDLRRTRDEVDFVAFSRLTETQRAIDRRCRESTRSLVLATANVMTPAQRQRYLTYVRSVLEPASGPL